MPMVNQNHVNKELYARVAECEKGIAAMNSAFSTLIMQNDKLIRLLTRVCYGLITISVFLLLIVAYGAIGDKGLHSVRKAMPSRIAAIPAPSDLDKWFTQQRRAA